MQLIARQMSAGRRKEGFVAKYVKVVVGLFELRRAKPLNVSQFALNRFADERVDRTAARHAALDLLKKICW
jgi:hypothetical protein